MRLLTQSNDYTLIIGFQIESHRPRVSKSDEGMIKPGFRPEREAASLNGDGGEESFSRLFGLCISEVIRVHLFQNFLPFLAFFSLVFGF